MNTKPDTSRTAFWTALKMAGEMGYLIIIPLLIFALGGRWLDQRYGTKPWLFLSGMAVAVVLTTVLLVRKFKAIIKEINQTNPPAPKS